MMRTLLTAGLALVMTIGLIGAASASSTIVPGHQDRNDADNNGYPDEGVTVNGHYTALYAYDANGDYYFDLGDGRVQGTVDSVDDLDQSTLTTCDYVVNYRGNFENDPFLDSGWIMNNINCNGYDDNRTYSYQIIHETDPRYTGDRPEAFGGDWEYLYYTIAGEGNTIQPEQPA